MATRRVVASGREQSLIATRWIIASTVMLFALPASFDLLSSPTRASYRWIAADTFYYLTVGRNGARHGALSYDGTHLSNGFQPLWQLWAVVTELAREKLHWGPIGPFLLALSGLVLIGAALALLGLTLQRGRRLSVLFLSAPVGVYGVTVLPVWVLGFRPLFAHRNWDWLLPVFGTPWSYVNGMESGLVLFFYALSLHLASNPRARRSAAHAVYLGFALAGLTLARLDHAFFTVALLCGYTLICIRDGLPAARQPDPVKRLSELAFCCQLPLLSASVLALCIVPYLLQNRFLFGNYVPLSGVAKSTFPHFNQENMANLRQLLRGSPSLDSDWWIQIACREAQQVVPAAYCASYALYRAFKRSAAPLTILLTASALGALLLSGYDFSFTPTYDQGYWYMPVATLLPTLFLLNGRFLADRWTAQTSYAAASALIAAGIVFFFCGQHHATYNRTYRSVMLQAAGEAASYYHQRLPKIIEVDDGVVGYALDTPALSSSLALDPQGFVARREGHLLELALARDFDHVATVAYRPSGTSDAALTSWLGAATAQDASQYTVHLEFLSSDGLLLIGKITRNAPVSGVIDGGRSSSESGLLEAGRSRSSLAPL